MILVVEKTSAGLKKFGLVFDSSDLVLEVGMMSLADVDEIFFHFLSQYFIKMAPFLSNYKSYPYIKLAPLYPLVILSVCPYVIFSTVPCTDLLTSRRD